MSTLRGCEVAGCHPVDVKRPGELRPGEDWWRCYQVDLITMRDVSSWRTFRRKWFAFLDKESLELNPSWEELNDLHWRLRAWFHEGIEPPGIKNWVLRLIQPEIFAAINGVKKVSHTGVEQEWHEVFHSLCIMGYLKLDEDERLFVDVNMLDIPDNEKVFDPTQQEAHYIQHYRKVMAGTAKEMEYKPPDWDQAVEDVARKHHQSTKIITHQ